jgi:hypothetical protein
MSHLNRGFDGPTIAQIDSATTARIDMACYKLKERINKSINQPPRAAHGMSDSNNGNLALPVPRE